MREITSQAHLELCVLDPYISPILFDPSEDFARVGVLRIITADTVDRATVLAYTTFRNQYPKAEMRVLGKDRIHDRFILWDGAHGVHLGHSVKDLGKKDTQLNVLAVPLEQYRLFEERWAAAKGVA